MKLSAETGLMGWKGRSHQFSKIEINAGISHW